MNARARNEIDPPLTLQPTIIPTEQQEFSIGEADALQSAIQGYTEAAEKREARMPSSADAMAKQGGSVRVASRQGSVLPT